MKKKRNKMSKNFYLYLRKYKAAVSKPCNLFPDIDVCDSQLLKKEVKK